MTSGHTPGPWTAELNIETTLQRGSYKSSNGKWYICAPSLPFGVVVTRIDGSALNDPRLTEANACLIAAAPELLAALEMATANLTNVECPIHQRRILTEPTPPHPDCDGCLDVCYAATAEKDARAAIAKARGEE